MFAAWDAIPKYFLSARVQWYNHAKLDALLTDYRALPFPRVITRSPATKSLGQEGKAGACLLGTNIPRGLRRSVSPHKSQHRDAGTHHYQGGQSEQYGR